MVQFPTVLIVEDESLICDLIIDALEDEGIATVCAASPDEAFEHLRTHAASIRVIVTDVNLRATLDGFDVAREARRLIPEIFVLYTTGHAEADIEARGVEGGMMVPKPYQPAVVAGRVAALARVADTY